MPRVILFDVNETLLDLHALDPHFARVFGSATVMPQWFAQVLRSALVATLTGNYHDFGTIAGDALEMTAMRHRVELTSDDKQKILGTVRALPPHPEVPASLACLQEAGLRMATLTNSPPHVLEAQMENAGLTNYFEQLISVDPTRKFKPAPEPYLHAAKELGVEPNGIRLVAAHDWDIAGAMQVGCAGAFVARPGMVLGPLQKKPDIIGPDMKSVVEQILEKEQ
ncbi:haloacid dehalogenase type II [Chloroflexi bacterium TSY]|nr:haloacid dehalogenase type II [Chloroflexi bacterium TSY]